MKRIFAVCVGMMSILLLTLLSACGGQDGGISEASQSESQSDLQEADGRGEAAESEEARFDENMLPLHVAEDFEVVLENEEVAVMEKTFEKLRGYPVMWNQSDDLAYCGEGCTVRRANISFSVNLGENGMPRAILGLLRLKATRDMTLPAVFRLLCGHITRENFICFQISWR